MHVGYMLALCRGCILTVFTLSSSLCKLEAYVLALWYIYALGLLGEGYGEDALLRLGKRTCAPNEKRQSIILM